MPIAISDYALACATGATTKEALDAIFSNQSGLRKENELFVGRVPGSLTSLPKGYAQFETRQAELALHTTEYMRETIENAKGKWGAHRIAVLIGTSTGGIAWTEKNYNSDRRGNASKLAGGALEKHSFGAVPRFLQQIYGLTGPAVTVSTACSSSAQILGTARRWIEQNIVDAVLAVGVDTLCDLTIRGFGGLGLLSKGKCKPFDVERDGINIGEAGAAMLLERENAHAKIFLRGFGTTSDGYHMTRPPPDGYGAVAAMKMALEDAELKPDDIVAINAHGTGTFENDRAESNAIQNVFGSTIPVVSNKGYTGHTLGAAGAVDAIISIASLERQLLPGTIGLQQRDPDLLVAATSETQPLAGQCILSNSFAFGGNNASLILEMK